MDKLTELILEKEMLQEFINWGTLPTTIYKVGRGQVWYINVDASKITKPKYFKRSLNLTVEDSNALKKVGGKSLGRIRTMYDPAEMMGRSVVDKGTVTMQAKDIKRYIELRDFKGFKLFKPSDIFHIEWGKKLRKMKDVMIVVPTGVPAIIRRKA